MADFLTEVDIDEQISQKLYTQNYTSKSTIEGVSLVEVENHIGEDGDLSEVLKLTDQGEVEQFPGFRLAQINRTKLFPGAIKGWHIHFRQDDIWYVVPSSHLVVGLWDIRKNSKTKGVVTRVVLGAGNSQLLFIPRGVAHGAVNVTQKTSEVFYFTNQKFDANTPDEKRLKWDSLGADFWKPLKD